MSKCSSNNVRTYGHYVNGEPMMGAAARLLEVADPVRGCAQANVEMATAREVRAAVDAAANALPGWSATTPLRRARVLFAFKALLEQHRDELVVLISAEHGKVIADAQGELTRGIEVVEFACGIPQLLKGEMSEEVGRGVDSWSVRQPVGVCAGITPFNFPAMVPLWMFPIAIAAGNTFILKPSEKNPGCSMRMAQLFTEAGLPAGVFNVVNGDREAVEALLAEPRVEAVSFVGSTSVARHVYRTGSEHGKRVQALGGAKNHLLVMPDADLEHTVSAIMGAAYGSAGERCMAISVVVAVAEIADALLARLTQDIRALRIGPGSDPQSDMGPLVSAEHLHKVRAYVELGVQQGASLVVDGREVEVADHPDGFFLGGCLFDHVTPAMRIYQEEIFGPVLCVVRVPDFEAGLALIDRHPFGNGSAIFTRDGGLARAFAKRVQTGMVGINVAIPVPMAFHSFGGWKQSLFGPLHMHGPEGVRFYTRLKTVTARWPADDTDPSTFHMPTMK